MPKVVAPWTWRRLLRDHGPEDAGYLLALLVLATWMDRDGYAYPSQSTWARGARKSPRMIQRYVARAIRDGWLSVVNAGRGGKGWRHNSYRCCAPDHTPLDEHDARMGDALTAQCGDIEGDDTLMSPARSNGDDTRMSSASSLLAGGDDTASMKVTTSRADGDDISDYMLTTSGCRTKSASENSRLRTHASEEARLAPSVSERVSREADQRKAKETEFRRTTIRELLRLGNTWAEIVRMTSSSGVTLEEVRRVAAEQSAEINL